MKTSKRKQLDKEHPVHALLEKVEQINGGVRAEVEHPFRYVDFHPEVPPLSYLLDWRFTKPRRLVSSPASSKQKVHLPILALAATMPRRTGTALLNLYSSPQGMLDLERICSQREVMSRTQSLQGFACFVHSACASRAALSD
ncbi:hypothetical protein ACIGHN_27690 [Acidovorax sp. NPDC077693]|uniref:hypothetical protein n=1 Tax=unclassified Acidovorax TaxID=2684926 RepID=UPI0037CA5400